MGTLYIDRRHCELDYEGGRLRISAPDEVPCFVPINGLERIVVTGEAMVHTGLLTRVAEHGVSVLFLGGRNARRCAEVFGYVHGDARRRLGQYRVAGDASEPLKWSQRLVHARGMALVRLYRHALAMRPDRRRQLLGVTRVLLELTRRIRQVADVASLRGLEGAIAAAHFDAYACLFSEELGFDGRNRRPPRDPVNAALSLGYTLTHAEAIRACRIAGLDPMLGMLHEPSHGRESLACDLNELARDCVEKLVWRLFAEKTLRAEGFERHAGGVSLNKHARQAFYAAFEKSAPTHRRRLRAAATIFAAHCAFVARGIVGSTAGACGEGTRPIGAETDQ